MFGCSFLANLLANNLTGSEDYWNKHQWPFGASLLMSGLLSWAVGGWLAGSGTRMLVDAETGEEVLVRPNHTLFFIKMSWWGPILLTAGAVVIVKDLM